MTPYSVVFVLMSVIYIAPDMPMRRRRVAGAICTVLALGIAIWEHFHK